MKYTQLTFEQRYTIECMLKQDCSKKSIFLAIGINESSFYRELRRNGSKAGKYCAKRAQILCDERRKEGHYKTFFSFEMQKIISEKLSKQWSPQQITGWCKRNGIPMVSHERIYQWIWDDKQNGGTFYKHLRNSTKKYKKRYGKLDKRGQIPNRTPIDQRPEIVNTKERFGDWEADLIIGENHKGAILTMVERQTGYILMAKTNGKKANDVRKQLINALAPFKDFVHTITIDNGKEFMEHEKVAEKLGAKIYFAHPYSSWERGLNEYSNKLIRQYIPKNQILTNINPLNINEIQTKLNSRPREKLFFFSPSEIFFNKFGKKLALSG